MDPDLSFMCQIHNLHKMNPYWRGTVCHVTCHLRNQMFVCDEFGLKTQCKFFKQVGMFGPDATYEASILSFAERLNDDPPHKRLAQKSH